MISSPEVGDAIEIDSKKFRIVDFSSHVYVYSESFLGRYETTVQEWFLADRRQNLFRLEVPANGDKKLYRLHQIDRSNKTIKQIKFRIVNKARF